VPQSLDRIERIGEAMPAGGRRHELCDTCGSLRAYSPRIEATFLPDHPGKNSTGRQTSSTVSVWTAAPSGSLAVDEWSGRCRRDACLCIAGRICQRERAH
jgi:hypothetical protein